MIKGIVPADRPLPPLHNITSSSTNVFPLTSTLCLMSKISVYVTSQSQEPKQSGAAKTKEKVREGRGVFFYLWKRPLTDATMKFKFKEERTLEQRKGEASKIREKYPERIPVIVEKEPRSQIQPLGKRKFLVPSEISVAQFMWIVRKRIQLTQVQALYLFVGKSLPQSSATMYEVYERHKDEDGFLYIAYSGENTFGSCDNE